MCNSETKLFSLHVDYSLITLEPKSKIMNDLQTRTKAVHKENKRIPKKGSSKLKKKELSLRKELLIKLNRDIENRKNSDSL